MTDHSAIASSIQRSWHVAAALLLALLTLMLLAGLACHTGKRKTQPIAIDTGSKPYADVVRAFYIGLAALQVGEQVRAEEQLTQATQLLPDEPAAWANLGLLSLRQHDFDAAAERLERARQLAPDSSQIHYLLGELALTRGDEAKALEWIRQAVDLDGDNLQAAYALAELLGR